MRKLLILALAVPATAAFSSTWVEVGDAPEGVPGHQDTVGVGALTGITGAISRPNGDHTDTYRIRISDPANFWASTKQSLGGFATTATGGNGDTRLFLWTEAGGIQLGNDDHAGAPDGLASTISNPAIFNGLTGGVVQSTAQNIVLEEACYLLSVTYFPNFPLDASNVQLATVSSPFTGLHGPNPQAGPFDHWTNSAGTTAFAYRIALNGAEFCTVPEPATIAALGLGVLAFVRRKRKS